MRPIITLALTAVLAITFASSRRNSHPASTNEVAKDTILSDDKAVIHYDTILLYHYVFNSISRQFYYLDDNNDSTSSASKVIIVSCTQSDKNNEQLLYNNFRHDSCLFFIDPQQRYFYTAHYWHNNSNGWICNYSVDAYDMLMGNNCSIIPGCAAIAITDEGFRIAVARLTNEETSTCTADEIWLMHDEYLDWGGNVTRVDKAEYNHKTMMKKYLRGEYTYVKGFYGVIL